MKLSHRFQTCAALLAVTPFLISCARNAKKDDSTTQPQSAAASAPATSPNNAALNDFARQIVLKTLGERSGTLQSTLVIAKGALAALSPEELRFAEVMRATYKYVENSLSLSASGLGTFYQTMFELLRQAQTTKADNLEEAERQAAEKLIAARTMLEAKGDEIEQKIEQAKTEFSAVIAARNTVVSSCLIAEVPKPTECVLTDAVGQAAPILKLLWTPEQKAQCEDAWKKLLEQAGTWREQQKTRMATTECQSALDVLEKLVAPKPVTEPPATPAATSTPAPVTAPEK